MVVGQSVFLGSVSGSAAVEAARVFTARMLRRWSLLRVEEPVTAIVTELVANVVEHAGTDAELRLSHNGEVRIEVADLDSSPPVLRSPHPLQESGRGMMIIDRYATTWGFLPTAQGKTVWAAVELRAGPAPWRPGNAS